MKKLIAHADQFAVENQACLNTGHLLLAIIRGEDTAANLLKLRGLTDTKIRTGLRSLGDEPVAVCQTVTDKADQIAASFQTSGTGPLHLLAAIASNRQAHASRILEEFGLDSMAVRTQALRCLTGITKERNAFSNEASSVAADKNKSLPLAEHLKDFSTSPLIGESRALEPLALEQNSGDRLPSQPPLIRAKRLIEMGRELEQKQRRKRAMQKEPLTDQDSLGQDEPPFPAQKDSEAPPLPTKPAVVASSKKHGFQLTPDRFPLLFSVGRNLLNEAENGQLDEIVGRTQEIERIADVLNKRRANSPCLVGPAGVGKTAVVEGLALKLSRGEVSGFDGKAIIEIRSSDLLNGTSVRGALSERLGNLRREVQESKGQIILFFDEFHTLISSNDGAEAIQELKTALGRGELPSIAATTSEEYTRHIETDPALARRFTVIDVPEPSESEAIQILKGVEPAYRKHHGIEFLDEALKAAVQLSIRYVNERALPDKAIALLDLAGAQARRRGADNVNALDLAQVLAEQLGVPAERLAAGDHERLLNLEGELAKRVIGHHHILTSLGETLRRNAAGFHSLRPIGSFLFLGPTGVGKTETAKALSNFLFPLGNALVRLDMSEFSEAHAVARLIGAPPGYVGHEEGGQLTQAVRRHPYSLVLLDEIEKAHQDVLKVLLQVLEDGRLTDGLGRTVDFKNTVIVMTSNLGSNLKTHRRHVGFGAARKVEEMSDISASILETASQSLPPELWNRIDNPHVFMPLNREEVGKIALLLLEQVKQQLFKEHEIDFQIGEGVIEALVAAGGYDPDFGARPMRRTIQNLVESPVARMVLSGEVSKGDTVMAEGADSCLSFQVNADAQETCLH